LKRTGRAPLGRLVAIAALALSASCQLFQDLDSAPYRLFDAGVEGGTCDPDSSVGCAAAQLCQSANDCMPGQVCCAALTTKNGTNVSCVASAAVCASMGSLAVQLCATDDECGTGGSCTTQTCSVAGMAATLKACSVVPFCQH
jgi:hypothetical protein